MSVQELQNYTSVSKYARWLKEKKRREIWPETAERYEQMLIGKYPHREEKIREVCQAIHAREVMPSMRGLQFGGKPVFQHNARIYNCTSSYCDRLKFFSEAFYLLLCGSGVGCSVQQRHIQHLPRFSKKRLAGIKLPKKTFRPEDSIEGWADTHAVLLSSWHEEPIAGFEEYQDCEPIFDLSGIRKKGSDLSFGIGKAPGPVPLRRSLLRNTDLLLRVVAEGLFKLNDVFASDYLMHEADAVVSGGVRRAATILLFDLFSKGMCEWKTGDWFDTNPQRARANISAILLRNVTSWEDFYALFQNTKQFGEPGFYWTNDPDCIANPCVEIGFWCKYVTDLLTEEGQRLIKNHQGPVYSIRGDGSSLADGFDTKVALSGWQMCNLATQNGKTIKGHTKEEKVESFYNRCEQAAFLGTWQAGFNSFPYLDEVSEKIVKKEALLGVSISGMMHHPDVFLDPEVLEKGAKIVLKVNEQESMRIGINPCARGTCVKPDGNSAATLGGFSGAGRGKFRRGFRIAQASVTEAVFKHFKSKNPQACEPCVWSADKTDEVIRFCCEYEGLMEEDATAIEYLEDVKLIQKHWVGNGKVKSRCSKPYLSHNVSNTVRVRPGEWHKVAKFIFDNQNFFSGVALLSWSGDRDYAQAPFTKVYSPEEMVEMYGEEAVESLQKENLLEDACYFANLWDACNLAVGLWGENRQPTDEQYAWNVDLKVFALMFFEGDIKKATYLLKDVYNWRLWLKLRDSYIPVDYSEMVEETNGVKLQEEAACSGGLCEV